MSILLYYFNSKYKFAQWPLLFLLWLNKSHFFYRILLTVMNFKASGNFLHNNDEWRKWSNNGKVIVMSMLESILIVLQERHRCTWLLVTPAQMQRSVFSMLVLTQTQLTTWVALHCTQPLQLTPSACSRLLSLQECIFAEFLYCVWAVENDVLWSNKNRTIGAFIETE